MTTDLRTFLDNAMKSLPIETRVVKKVIAALAKNGTPIVAVYDGEEEEPATTKQEVLDLVFNLDECYLFTADRSWVRVVLGNGWDCIVDYTTDLEAALADVNALIEKNY